MNELISLENIALSPITENLLSLNEFSRKYGLALTPKEAKELSDTRNKAVSDNERIEIGSGAVPDIVKRFCTSHYISAENYTYILNEVTYLFYYIKTETDDKISDGDLIDELFKRFELQCRGSIDMLQTREVGKIIRMVNSGEKYFEWYKDRDELDYDSKTGLRDTPETMLEDEFGKSYFTQNDTEADHDKYETDTLDALSEDNDEKSYLDAFDEFLDREALMNRKNTPNPDVAIENPDDKEESNE